MLPTLQRYILREMGKTFALAGVGMTAVIALGGGMSRLTDFGQITPSQLASLMLLVLPMSASLTLPIAALYSASATFGRLSADNELIACRSSGINIHRLFIPPFMLSVAVAVCTFYFTSFLFPSMVRNIETLAKSDLRQFVLQNLDSPERLTFEKLKLKIYADQAAAAPGDSQSVAMRGAAFLKVSEDNNDFSHFGTAETMTIAFDRDESGEIAVSGRFTNAVEFERGQGWGEAADQSFGPISLPSQLRLKVKMLNVLDLWRYRRAPQEWPGLADKINNLRTQQRRDATYDAFSRTLDSGLPVQFADDEVVWTIEADAATVVEKRDESKLELASPIVTEQRGQDVRVMKCREGEISIISHDDPSADRVIVRLRHASVEDESGTVIGRWTRRSHAFALSADSDIPVASANLLSAELQKETRKFLRKVNAELHSRLAFNVSVLVLVVLGAALGIIFRGTHLLAAFGIAFVPALLVLVLNIAGRQLAEKDGTVMLGIGLIWGGIAVVAILDGWAMIWGIRR